MPKHVFKKLYCELKIFVNIAISFAVAMQYMKDWEASRKPLGSLEACALSPLPSFLAHAPEGRELIPGFTVLSADKTS